MENKRLNTLLEDLIQHSKETEWLEFKVDNANPEMIGENISALSNGASLKNKPFGYIVFGVEDNTHICAFKWSKFEKQAIWIHCIWC